MRAGSTYGRSQVLGYSPGTLSLKYFLTVGVDSVTSMRLAECLRYNIEFFAEHGVFQKCHEVAYGEGLLKWPTTPHHADVRM